MPPNQAPQPVLPLSQAAMGGGRGRGGGGPTGPQLAQQTIAQFAADQQKSLSRFIQSAGQVQEAQQRQAEGLGQRVTSAINEIVDKQDELGRRKESRQWQLEDRDFQAEHSEKLTRLRDTMERDQIDYLRQGSRIREGGQALIDNWKLGLTRQQEDVTAREKFLKDPAVKKYFFDQGPGGIEDYKRVMAAQESAKATYEDQYFAPYGLEVEKIMVAANRALAAGEPYTELSQITSAELAERMDLSPLNPEQIEDVWSGGGYPSDGILGLPPDDPRTRVNRLDPNAASDLLLEQSRWEMLGDEQSRREYVEGSVQASLDMRDNLNKGRKYEQQVGKLARQRIPRAIGRGLQSLGIKLREESPDLDMVNTFIDDTIGFSIGPNSEALGEYVKGWLEVEATVVDTAEENGIAMRYIGGYKAMLASLAPVLETQPGEAPGVAETRYTAQTEAASVQIQGFVDALVEEGFQDKAAARVIENLLAADLPPGKEGKPRKYGRIYSRAYGDDIRKWFGWGDGDIFTGAWTAETKVKLKEAVRTVLIDNVASELNRRIGILETQPYPSALRSMRATNARGLDWRAIQADSVDKYRAAVTARAEMEEDIEGKGPDYFQAILGPSAAFARLLTMYPDPQRLSIAFLTGKADHPPTADTNPELLQLLADYGDGWKSRIEKITAAQRQAALDAHNAKNAPGGPPGAGPGTPPGTPPGNAQPPSGPAYEVLSPMGGGPAGPGGG